MHAQAFLSLALAGLALAAPQAGHQGPRPTPEPNWNWGSEHHNKTITTTKTLTAYTTYCPGPTTLHFNGKKYTVTKETTLTITDCPCTVTETHPPTHRPHHPTTGSPLPPPKTTGSAEQPSQTGSAPPPSQPTVNPPVNNNSPPSTPNTPNTPNVKVSGAEGSNTRFGLAVAAGVAIAGLMAL